MNDLVPHEMSFELTRVNTQKYRVKSDCWGTEAVGFGRSKPAARRRAVRAWWRNVMERNGWKECA